MAKGSFISPFLLGSKNSNASSSPSDDLSPPSAAPSRSSTSSRFPSLRRLETANSDSGASSATRPSSMQSKPAANASGPAETPGSSAGSSGPGSLLHIKFSGPSFLDVVAKDNVSKEPLYIIETVREVTTIYRLDHRTREAVRAASVQWPQTLVKGKTSGRTVQMGDGRWRDAEEFLKFGTLTNFA